MKRKIFYISILFALSGLIALQSCKKDEVVTPSKFNAFSAPKIVAPADASTINVGTATTYELKWESSSTDGIAPLSDVYFGVDNDPALFKADHNALSITVPVTPGLTYHWYVVMKDPHNVTTEGPVWSFKVFEPIAIFVGNFNAAEPAESYSYGVSFVKTTPTTIKTSNYWNSGWDATFTLNFTNNTYSMPNTTWGTYSGVESGTIDPATGKMIGNYTIYHPVVPVPIAVETGVHTYTKLP